MNASIEAIDVRTIPEVCTIPERPRVVPIAGPLGR